MCCVSKYIEDQACPFYLLMDFGKGEVVHLALCWLFPLCPHISLHLFELGYLILWNWQSYPL